MYPSITTTFEFLEKELREPTAKGAKDARPLGPGKFPVPEKAHPIVRDCLPPRGMSHFMYTSRRDSALTELLPVHKKDFRNKSPEREAAAKTREETIRLQVANLSLAMWTSRTMAEILQQRKKEEEEEAKADGEDEETAVDPMVRQLLSLLRPQRHLIAHVAHLTAVDLTRSILTRRDSILDQVDRLLPPDELSRLRTAPSLLSDRLFDGQASESVKLLEVRREREALPQGIKALTSVLKQRGPAPAADRRQSQGGGRQQQRQQQTQRLFAKPPVKKVRRDQQAKKPQGSQNHFSNKRPWEPKEGKRDSSPPPRHFAKGGQHKSRGGGHQYRK
jgi:hypothetical protein